MSNHYRLEDYATLKGLTKSTVARAIEAGRLHINFDEMGFPYLSLRDNINGKPSPNRGGQNET